MSNFQLVRYKASDSWVPETDIDGVDANETVVAEANNVEFSNGFFENTVFLRRLNTPTAIVTKFSDGYIQLSGKTFKHSTQGNQIVRILWKESTASLSIFVNDTEILVNDGIAITYLAKPENISYNLVNDQLKINLNITATYPSPFPVTPVILNLTLVYLPETAYSSAITRSAGWYLCPRWLGWSVKDLVELGTIVTNRLYDFETGLGGVGGESITYWESCSFIRTTSFHPLNGIWCIYSAAGTGGIFLVGNVSKATRISFVANSFMTDGITVRISAGVGGATLSEIGLTSSIEGWESFNVELPFDNNIAIQIFSSNDGDLYLDDITLHYGYAENYIIVAKYLDGQRAILSMNEIFMSNSKLKLYKSSIDWRIAGYEIYRTIDGLTMLVQEIGLLGWTDAGSTLTHIFDPEVTETTLNFKYNLPATARVDNQRIILSEIVHKGRVYFVNGDYKVYQSHISTNLAIQADAFPYDEETGFGYFIVDHSKTNLALANSPTNDMVIMTSDGLYIYFIQPSGSGAFKQLKMGSGNIAISNIKTLTSLLNGDPATDGLFWIDNNGIYYYGGGMTPPENLITLTHLRYWQTISEEAKNNAVGFYHPAKKEYWLNIDDEFLIFELSFKKFRRLTSYDVPMEFMGYQDLVPYYITIGNIIACDGTTRLAGQIDSHYNTIEGNPEVYHKILQELYLEFGTSDSGVNVTMQVLVDDWVVATYLFNSSKRFDKWLSPAGVRFNRIKLKVFIPGGNYIRIKEFGFSYSPDLGEPLGIVPVSIATSGYGFDYGNDYGNPPI